MADVPKCETLLTGYSGFRKLFRYPYLDEGRTAQARDALRERLRAAGYRVGHVTIDTSDWAIDRRLLNRLAQDPSASLEPYRRFYLQHMWERATFYDELARKLFGGSIDHTLLLHHRLTTALFLDDVLKMFRRRGWRLVDAQEAFATPILALEPKSLPSGQSLVWAVAKERGGYDSSLRYKSGRLNPVAHEGGSNASVALSACKERRIGKIEVIDGDRETGAARRGGFDRRHRPEAKNTAQIDQISPFPATRREKGRAPAFRSFSI